MFHLGCISLVIIIVRLFQMQKGSLLWKLRLSYMGLLLKYTVRYNTDDELLFPSLGHKSRALPLKSAY